MKRALALAAALTALTLTGAGCAAKNDAPPPQMKTSYPSPDYPPQTEQTPVPAPQPQGRPGGPMLSRLFDVMDTDHNGRVTLEEWRAFQEKEFRRLDKNDDGVLTREEMTAQPPLPGQNVRPAP